MVPAVVIIVAGLSLLGIAGFVLVRRPRAAGAAGMQGLMGGGFAEDEEQTLRDPFELDRQSEIALKRRQKLNKRMNQQDTRLRLFRAGFYTAEDHQRYARFRVWFFFAAFSIIPLAIYLLAGANLLLLLLSVAIGGGVGIIGPSIWLDRKINARQEEILYYLPLVVEQISIGVSSALDVGPCIAHIIQMADDRDAHNPVTELLVSVEKLIRSGLTLEEGLADVAETSGHPELKHAFMFLGQCAKHGGEVTKQLQELADAVSVQREIKVEARITSLPVKATGPLAMIFGGFFILLACGIFIRIFMQLGTAL